ncbi:ImmA/IrrE family metallo-endopeptidase [Leuconostoc carnosum]|uniref:ImmA/IrrE family metallo-endopeptidase n=1 Tax=Leuconostoc carnosum TaxID=1252 RepID=UPI003886047F
MNNDYLYQQIVTSLENKALTNDVVFVNAYDLSPDVPDAALIETRAIIMNNYFDINAGYAYRFAHELSHILYGDPDAQAVYYFSEYGKRGEELLAHRNAIRMLMSIEMPTTVNGFMEYYHVPSWLDNYANETFKSLSVVE